MKIICDSCGAKYTVSDEKVQGKTVKIKCRKCSAVIVVSTTGEVQTTGGGASPGTSYTVSVTDTDQRTMTVHQIVDAYNEGIIDAETFVWAEGMGDWLPLKDVDEVVDALHDAAEHIDAVEAVAAAPEEAGGEALGQTVAIPEGFNPEAAIAAAQADRAAAAAAPEANDQTVAMAGVSAADFGVPPEEPFGAVPAAVQQAAAVAAVGSGAGAFGSPSAAGGPPADAGVAAAGSGGDSSAIFSLDMLTAKAGGSQSAATSSSEDSGLIDLKALASGMGSDPGIAAPAAAPAGGVFPLGAPPPIELTAPTQAEPAVAQGGGSNKALVVGLGVVVVALAAGLLFVVMSGGDETTADAAAPATVVVTQIVQAPTPTTPAEPTATASASASSSAVAKAPPAVGGPVRRQPPKTTSGGGTTKAPPPPKAPPPAPKVGTCGCAKDNLMCLMQCKNK